MIRSLTFLAVVFGLMSCGKAVPRESLATRRPALDVSAAIGEKMSLSWQAQASVSTYHVFYVVEGRALEIDSLPKDDPRFNAPRLTIDKNNMESWPKKGKKACFYVVAENAGILSEPSDQACATM